MHTQQALCIADNRYASWVQARASAITCWCSHPDQSSILEARSRALQMQQEYLRRSALLRAATVRRQLFFPDRRLLQFDCGKLQVGSCLPVHAPDAVMIVSIVSALETIL